MFKVLFGLYLAQSLSAQTTVTQSKYDIAIDRLEKVALSYPSQAQMFTLGANDQGIAIKGLKVGSGKTNSLVVATHHGNEYGSTEVGLVFAEALAKNPIKDQTVWIIPVLNISGYNVDERFEKTLNTWLDSNRDYPGPCNFYPSFVLKSTKALAQFLVSKNIIISATLHTRFPAVVYPWGISTQDLLTPYDNEFQKLATAATMESGYRTGNITDILYAADGTFEDYAYWKHGIWSLLFEMGFTHTPDATALKNMVTVNIPGIKRFLEQAPKQRAPQFAFTGKCDESRHRLQRILLE